MLFGVLLAFRPYSALTASWAEQGRGPGDPSECSHGSTDKSPPEPGAAAEEAAGGDGCGEAAGDPCRPADDEGIHLQDDKGLDRVACWERARANACDPVSRTSGKLCKS